MKKIKLSSALKLVEAHPSKRYSFACLTEREAINTRASWYQQLYNNARHLDYNIVRRGSLITIERCG
jgi:hypothetical protein